MLLLLITTIIYLGEKRVVDFKLNLLVIQEEKLIIPNIKYTNKIMLKSNEFYNICKNCSDIDDYLKIESYSNNVKFEVYGMQQKGYIMFEAIKNPKDIELKNQLVKIDSTQTIEQIYSLKYLQMFANACMINGSITLQLHKEYPLCVECKLKDDGFIRYYLVPQNDD